MMFIKVQPVFRCKVCNSNPIIEGPDWEDEDNVWSCHIQCPKCEDRGFLSTSPDKSHVMSGSIKYWNYMQY